MANTEPVTSKNVTAFSLLVLTFVLLISTGNQEALELACRCFKLALTFVGDDVI